MRRFTKANAVHPAYQAMAEVGRAQRTIFLARFLRDRDLQREINEGLNVVESWNRANAVIFFGKGGDIATNRRDEQELSVLCLRILQAALVYVNTLMVQDVLADQTWTDRLTAEDRRGLTPLFWAHVPTARSGSIWAAACPCTAPSRPPRRRPGDSHSRTGPSADSGPAQGPAARQVPARRAARLRLPQGSVPAPARGTGRGSHPRPEETALRPHRSRDPRVLRRRLESPPRQ